MRTHQNFHGTAKVACCQLLPKAGFLLLGCLLSLSVAAPESQAAESGITDTSIRVGATVPLKGDYKIYGVPMQLGMQAALKDQKVQGRNIEYIAINDFYDPDYAVKAVNELIDQGVFLMANSFGSPTTRAVLPLLAKYNIPALAFYADAGITGPGDIFHIRAGYSQEAESVADAALASGLKPAEICVYAQNDAYGMSSVRGVRNALTKIQGTRALVSIMDELFDMPGENPERNGIGPVGVYPRDATSARHGYKSLKKWEAASGYSCRLVIITSSYKSAATFIGYAHLKKEPWVFSISSPVTADDRFVPLLKEFGATQAKVVSTQNIPSPDDSTLPIVAEARQAIGKDNFNRVSLESYIAGKLLIKILQSIEGPLTRKNLLAAIRSHPYDIGGIKIDFSNSNQGSAQVFLEHLRNNGRFESITSAEFSSLLK